MSEKPPVLTEIATKRYEWASEAMMGAAEQVNGGSTWVLAVTGGPGRIAQVDFAGMSHYEALGFIRYAESIIIEQMKE